MLYVKFNNTDSRDLNLVIENRWSTPIPSENITHTTIFNDEDVTYSTGYSNIEIPINFACNINTKEQRSKVKKWLHKIEGNRLILSTESNKYYIVKDVKTDPISDIYGQALRFTVTFICSPFAYLNDGIEVITITSPTTLINYGFMEAKPYMKIYGSGTITLIVNSISITFNNVTDYIEVDSRLMDCYKDSTLRNGDMIGDFPILEAGENNISWTGTITKIEIEPRWRE